MKAASPDEGAQSLAANPSSPVDEVLVSIVVPTYREADNLPLLVPRITAALERWSHEIIIVDDNSEDGTDQVVESLSQQGHALRLIVRTDQRGLSSAVLRGFADAKGEVLICMDADLSHPPETLPHMIQTLKRGDVEFVIGSRYVRGGTTDEEWSWFRRLNSKVATLMARPFCQAKDPLAGYFALPRPVFERAEALNPVGYKIGLELLVKCGCTRIAEVPIHFSGRRFGQSKLSLGEQINYLRHLKRLADFKFEAARGQPENILLNFILARYWVFASSSKSGGGPQVEDSSVDPKAALQPAMDQASVAATSRAGT